MPSSLTNKLYSGPQTFREFALGCLPGLFAFREGVPEDVVVPSEDAQRCAEQAARCGKELIAIEARTDEEAQKQADLAFEQSLGSVIRENKIRSERHARCLQMRAEVMAWKAPTPEHEGFKKEMLNQLDSLEAWDCKPHGLPVRQSGIEYRNSMVVSTLRSFGSWMDMNESCERNARETTKWLSALRASL